MAERAFMDFFLSPTVYAKGSDLLTVFTPSFLGLLCMRRRPGTRHMERARCLEATTCPVSGTAGGRRQTGRGRRETPAPALPGKPRHSTAAGSLPGITNLPVLRHRLSLSFPSFVWVEKVVHKDLYTNSPQRQLPYYVK